MGSRTGGKSINPIFSSNCFEIKLMCSVPMLDETEISYKIDQHQKIILIAVDNKKLAKSDSDNDLKLKSLNIIYHEENNTFANYYINELNEVKTNEIESDNEKQYYFIMKEWIPIFDMINNFALSTLDNKTELDKSTIDYKYEAKSKIFNNISYSYYIKNKKLIEFEQQKEIEKGMTAFFNAIVIEEREIDISSNEYRSLLAGIPRSGLKYEKFLTK